MADYLDLPANLPVPADDGAAAHLVGQTVPDFALPSTQGGEVDLAALRDHLTVLFIYPLSGRPGVDMPAGWDDIPGARGCTPEACGFRDHFGDLRAAGAETLLGLSSQGTEYQAEFAERLGLPFALLSDSRLELARTLGLPTFTVEGRQLYRRMTLVLRGPTIEHVFYPVFPPDKHAAEVLRWLRERQGRQTGEGVLMAALGGRPYVQFNFLVDLGDEDTEAPHAGFQECSNLGIEDTGTDYRPGSDKEDSVRKITGLSKATEVTLKRGAVGADALYRWLGQTRDGDERAERTVLIRLQNEDHRTIVQTWKLHGARITRHVSGPMNAKGTDVAMEELTLAYERMEMA